MKTTLEEPSEAVDKDLIAVYRRRRIRAAVPWWLFGMALLAVFAGLLSLIRVPVSAPVEGAAIEPGIGVGLTTDHQIEADLLDPTPLFLPTRINATPVGPDRHRLASKGNFQPYPPRFFNSSGAVELSFAPIIELPASPAKGLMVGERPNPYRNIGQSDAELTALPRRLAFLEVTPAGGGAPVLAVELQLPSKSPTSDWHPLEWIAAVDRKGLVGTMSLVSASLGLEEMDVYFRKHLTERFHLWEKLRPGLYRVRVGP